MYQGHITGGLEPDKQADVIVVDHQHYSLNTPSFERDFDAVYSQ